MCAVQQVIEGMFSLEEWSYGELKMEAQLRIKVDVLYV